MDSNTHSTSQPARTPAGTQAGFQALVADPDGAQAQAERQHQRRGLWLSPTWEGMVALQGLLDPEAGQTLLAALEPLARPHQRPRCAQRWPATGRCPDRAGPPHPGGRPAPPERWGPAPAAGHRRPGQPPRPRWAGRGDRRALAAGPRGLPAAGLRRRRHPGPGQPPPHPPGPGRRRPPGRPRPRRQGQPAGLAPDGGDPAPPDPGRRPHPTTGGRPDQPGRHPRPTGRPGRPRRRLCGGRLRPAPGLVRSPPPPTLAARRPHRPRQPGPALPGPSSRGPRGRLAAGPRPRRPADRHPTPPKTRVPPPDPATP